MSSRRKHESDSDDDDFSYARKKRRTSDLADIENRLQSLILRVGEKSSASLESNLEGLAGVLDADLPNYKQKIIRILAECVTRMPEKTTIYSTLIGLLNAKSYNFGGEFVELLVKNLRETLKAYEFGDARFIHQITFSKQMSLSFIKKSNPEHLAKIEKKVKKVRFLSDLVNSNVIVAASLLNLYENFIDVTLENGIPQSGQLLHEKKELEFAKLLLVIESYIRKRQHIHVPALRVWSSDKPHPQEEYLDCLWSQIKQLASNKWVEKQIIRPYLCFDLHEALQHALPQISPPLHHEDVQYPLPCVVFRMFDYADVPGGPVLPGMHAIERYLIEQMLDHILMSGHNERKDCAVALLECPTKTKFPLNYMIVEVILSHLFRLPRPPLLEIFYGSLLIELCKLQPTSMPQVLAQATEMVYSRIDTMKTACIERLCTWFAYHLSNFQFSWRWQDWAEVLHMDPFQPKPVFVREVLAKCLRLSYHERLVAICPEDFSPFIPSKPTPKNKYTDEGAGQLPGMMVATRLTEAIKQKCTPETTVEILRDLPQIMSGEGDTSYNPLKIDVFITTLLNLGSKTFTHTFSALAKFHMVLKSLCETEEGQVCLLKVMYEVWNTHPQMMCVLVDKLLKIQVIECASVANWLFSQEMSQDFTRFYVWEIMHNMITVMNRQVTILQSEVDDARDRLELSRRINADTKDTDAPTEEMIERIEEKLEAAHAQQKNLFLIIFQRFIIILTNHLAKCESTGVDYNTNWYKWVIERLQHIFLQHHELVNRHISTLETLLFTSDTDFHILELFQQFCALRS